MIYFFTMMYIHHSAYMALKLENAVIFIMLLYASISMYFFQKINYAK